jgi:hypothetical protein
MGVSKYGKEYGGRVKILLDIDKGIDCGGDYVTGQSSIDGFSCRGRTESVEKGRGVQQ